MRLECHPRPDYERKHEEEEDEAKGTEQQEPGSGGVSCDCAVGARFPEQCDPGDRRAREAHRKGQQSEVLWGIEQDQGREQGHEGREQKHCRREAFGAGGDPEVPHPRASPHKEHVSCDGRRSGQLHSQVEGSLVRTGLREGDQGKERREDDERVEYVRNGAGESSRGNGHGG
jgi:hypothetical protein